MWGNIIVSTPNCSKKFASGAQDHQNIEVVMVHILWQDKYRRPCNLFVKALELEYGIRVSLLP